jgi:PAS domain S-box-containing protein
MSRKRRSILLTAAIFAVTFGICIIFVFLLIQKDVTELRNQVGETGSAQAYTLQRQLDRSLSATYALAAYIHQFGDIHDFNEIAGDLIERYGGITNLQLAPGAVVRQIHPLEGNEAAIGHDLLNDPRRQTETLLAIESGELTLAGPFELIQGGVAVIGRYPVFIHHKKDSDTQKFWGFAIALIRLPELITASNLDQLVLNGYDYELSKTHADTQEKYIFAKSRKGRLHAPVSIAVEVPNGKWTLSIAPQNGWYSVQFIAASILAIALLSTIVASLFYQRIGYSNKLSLSNEKLNKEIQEHSRTIESLERSETLFRAVAQTAKDGIITINSRDDIVYMNNGAETMFGYSPDEVVGKPLTALMPESYYEDHKSGLERVVMTDETKIIGKTVELEGLKKDGKIFPLELSLARWETTEDKFITAILRDISERKELEKEVLYIEERERRRIGYDMHDDLGQLLTGLSFKSSSLEYDLKDKMIPEAEEATKISSLIETAKNKVKLLSKWILPVDPDEQGFVSALQELASNTQKIFDIQCDFIFHESISIKDEAATTNLYRIAQEAVNNAVRHSKAMNIEIGLGKENNNVIMTIRDNGTGLNNSPGTEVGMGIKIMNYRAGLIGATLDINEHRDGGTLVKCRYPV